MNATLRHYYNDARRHQQTVFANGGGSLTTFMDGTAPQMSYGGAPYGEHAISAFMSAKRRIAFAADLSATIKASKRRSAAAKRGWKTRRANAV